MAPQDRIRRMSREHVDSTRTRKAKTLTIQRRQQRRATAKGWS